MGLMSDTACCPYWLKVADDLRGVLLLSLAFMAPLQQEGILFSLLGCRVWGLVAKMQGKPAGRVAVPKP